MIMDALILAVFPGLLIFAAVTDLLTMTIPNRVPVGLLLCFAAVALVSGMGMEAVAIHLGIGLAVLLFSFCLFSFGYLGGGDAKLLAATALWFGWTEFLPFVITTALCGGVLAIGLLAARTWPLPAGLARLPWLARLHDSSEGAPYGIAIAAGALVVYPDTHWVSLIVG
ncbi:MAG: prepilin peptidase [Hyphomicrobiales bacterium]|nr:prepilin peptidase [Hyphomicrobiales bacterium]